MNRVFLLRVAFYFPPLVKGGQGGVETHSLAIVSVLPFFASAARPTVRRPNKRLKIAATFRREKRARFPGLASPPPLPPLYKGGKEECTLAEFAQQIGEECKTGAIPTFHHPRVGGVARVP